MAEETVDDGTGGGAPAREVVVTGVGGTPRERVLIRRAAGLARSGVGGALHVVHVRRAADGNDVPADKELEAQRRLTVGAGGSFHMVGGGGVAAALLEFARGKGATQIVVGSSRRRWRDLAGRGTVGTLLRGVAGEELHVVPLEEAPSSDRALRVPARLGRRRETWGFALAVALPALLQVALGLLPHAQLTTDMLVQLSGIIAVALVGGLRPAVLAAALAGLIVNYFSVRPFGSLSVFEPENVFALLVFVLVAVAVSLVVDRSARRSKDARLAGAEARILADLSRRAVAEDTDVPTFLDRIREHFQVDAVGLWTRNAAERGVAPWGLAGSSGGPVPETVEGADVVEYVDGDRALTLSGRVLNPHESRVLTAFGAHLLAMLQREELRRSQRENLRLEEGNKMRTAILRAVSHDLRTPLASIKLASGSLRNRTVVFSAEEREEFLGTIEAGADRLDRLISNLLDMSRITADAVSPLIRPVYWADAVGDAVRDAGSERVRILLPYNLPPVDADPGMLERVVANLVQNALKYAPDSDVVVSATVGGYGDARIGDAPASELRIIDRGPGVPPAEVLALFRPFQRADDTTPGTGIGLGLAVAKGFTEAMGGVLAAEPTPGGGLTMLVRLPLSTATGGPSTGKGPHAGSAGR